MIKKHVKSSEKCNAWGANRLYHLMNILDTSNLLYEMFCCKWCGLLQVGRIISHGDTGRLNAEGDAWGKEPNPEWELRRKQTFSLVLSRLKRYGITKGALLDVGCGFGGLLEIASSMGFAVCGVDASPVAVKYIRNKLGFQAFCGLSEAFLEAGPFDVVTCLETLYYMRDPFKELGFMHEASRPGGLLVVTCLANRSWLYRAARWFRPRCGRGYTLKPGGWLYEHTCRSFYLFNSANLKQIIQRSGFHICGIHNEHQELLFRGRRYLFDDLGKTLWRILSNFASIATFQRFNISFCVTLYARRK